ncbi:carboxypeptidase regulatory-like domain-containing protein [Shewanella waksmanii]|uniref:carboxypeptidase regulatory-like domain-containing protein n=1 Tax=Shewanella waksmanii TaxID=213783 RepID=UPI0037358BF2
MTVTLTPTRHKDSKAYNTASFESDFKATSRVSDSTHSDQSVYNDKSVGIDKSGANYDHQSPNNEYVDQVDSIKRTSNQTTIDQTTIHQTTIHHQSHLKPQPTSEYQFQANADEMGQVQTNMGELASQLPASQRETVFLAKTKPMQPREQVSKVANKSLVGQKLIQGEMVQLTNNQPQSTGNVAQQVQDSASRSLTRGKSQNQTVIEAAQNLGGFSVCAETINRHYVSQPTEDEQFIISQLRYAGEVLSEELFAYQQGNTVYLPVQLLAELLLLPVVADMDTLAVNGWFKSQNAEIEVSNGLMKYLNYSADCSRQDTVLFYDDWDIYIAMDVIKQMFGLDIQFQANRQLFLISESIDIPLSQLKQRQKRYQLFNAQKASTEQNNVVHVGKDNALLGDVALNVDLGVNALKQGDPKEFSQEVSAQAKVDLLNHQTYLSYSQSESGESLTAYIEKNTPEAWVKHYRLGTVNSQSMPLVSDGDQGLGFTVSAGDGSTQDLRYIIVEGEWLRDWDVELYRNHALVDVKRIGADGLYRFEQVPYFIGLNQYQLRFFGPNGETKVENFSRLLDDSVLEKGDAGFQAGALAREQDDLQQYYVSGQYALTENITTGLAVIRQEQPDDDWMTISKLNLNVVGDHNLLQLNYAHNGQGYAAGATLQGSADTVDWIADWSFYEDFSTWGNPNERLQQQANLAFNGSLDNLPISWSLGADWRDYTLSADSLQANARLSGQLQRLSLSAELRWLQTGSVDDYIGRLAISGKLSDWYLRSYLDLGLTDDRGIDIWVANANRSIGEHLNYQVEMRYQPQSYAEYSIRNSISYLFDYGSLRLMVDTDSEGDWFGQIKWNSSALWFIDDNTLLLERLNYLNTGAIKLIVYQDDNGNDRYDDDEILMQGVRFSGHSQASKATDEFGQLLITQLRVDQPHKLSINEASLPDPFLVAKMPNFSVDVHPGNVQQVYYPIVNTAELEGSAFIKGDEQLAAKGKLVELVSIDKTHHYRTYVEFDGIFLFDGITPATYELSIQSEVLQTIAIKPGQFVELAPIHIENADVD